MHLVTARFQWPLLPSSDRVPSRSGGADTVRNRPVSPFSPQPLATAPVSNLVTLPRPRSRFRQSRNHRSERSPLRNWSALHASPLPLYVLKPSAERNISFFPSNQS